MANLTPSKFTPFARQGYNNKGRRGAGLNDQKENYSSHRVLTYEMMDKMDTAVKPETLNFAKLPKKVLESPAPTLKVPLITTPISTGMEMYNYVSEKGRQFKAMLAEGHITRRSY